MEKIALSDCPQVWKTLRDISLYRTVKLSSCVSKVMERMVLAHLVLVLEKHGLYPVTMAGFHGARSSRDSVIDLVTSPEKESHRLRLTHPMFVDNKTAFDNVSHDDLLYFLESMVIRVWLNQWIATYFRGRMLFIATIDGVTSDHAVPNNVPQGGALIPMPLTLACRGITKGLQCPCRPMRMICVFGHRL